MSDMSRSVAAVQRAVAVSCMMRKVRETYRDVQAQAKPVLKKVIRTVRQRSFWKFLVKIYLRYVQGLFAPFTIWRQAKLAFALQIAYAFVKHFSRFCYERSALISKKRTRQLISQMNKAETYQEWEESAKELDVVEGTEQWKQEIESPLYDWQRLERKYSFFKMLMQKQDSGYMDPDDCAQIIFHLRTGMKRDQMGLNNPGLYTTARVGTKYMVESYVAQLANLLQRVVEMDEVPNEKKLQFLNQTRHSYGRTALLLSGGGTLGLFHMGVIKALWEQKLLPRIICGSSAGSIVSSILACKPEADLADVFSIDYYEDFNLLGTVDEMKAGGPSPFWARVQNFLSKGVVFDIEVVEEFLRKQIGDVTFKEAFDITGRVLNITVVPNNYGASRQPRLLNYLTYPNVLVWSASVASCAIPGVFESVELLAKDEHGFIRPYNHDGVKYSDGSFGNDLPLNRLRELFNVNLFIVSQVNPTAIVAGIGGLGSDVPAQMIRFLKSQAQSFLRNIWRMRSLLRLEMVPLLRIMIPTLIQETEGDITAMAPIELQDLIHSLESPSKERVKQMMMRGERCMWKQISQVDTRCLVEFALDDCIKQVRAKMLRQLDQDAAAEGQAAGPGAGFYSQCRVDSHLLSNEPSTSAYDDLGPSASATHSRDHSMSMTSLVDLTAEAEEAGLEMDRGVADAGLMHAPLGVGPRSFYPRVSSELSVTMANYRRSGPRRHVSQGGSKSGKASPKAGHSAGSNLAVRSQENLQAFHKLHATKSMNELGDGFDRDGLDAQGLAGHHQQPGEHQEERGTRPHRDTWLPVVLDKNGDGFDVSEEEGQTKPHCMYAIGRVTGYANPNADD